jgi:hypothetical protein
MTAGRPGRQRAGLPLSAEPGKVGPYFFEQRAEFLFNAKDTLQIDLLAMVAIVPHACHQQSDPLRKNHQIPFGRRHPSSFAGSPAIDRLSRIGPLLAACKTCRWSAPWRE